MSWLTFSVSSLHFIYFLYNTSFGIKDECRWWIVINLFLFSYTRFDILCLSMATRRVCCNRQKLLTLSEHLRSLSLRLEFALSVDIYVFCVSCLFVLVPFCVDLFLPSIFWTLASECPIGASLLLKCYCHWNIWFVAHLVHVNFRNYSASVTDCRSL